MKHLFRILPNANSVQSPNPTQLSISFPLLSHHTLFPRHPLSPSLHLIDFPLNAPLFRHQRRSDLLQLRDLLFGGGFADFLHDLEVMCVSTCVVLLVKSTKEED
jgi:hypothetical protein